MFRFHCSQSGVTSPQRGGSIKRSRPLSQRDRHVNCHRLRLEWLEPRALLSAYFPNVAGDASGTVVPLVTPQPPHGTTLDLAVSTGASGGGAANDMIAGANGVAAPASSVTITLTVTATSTTFGSDAFYFTATTNDTSIWMGPPIQLIIDNKYYIGYGIYARSLSWGVPFGPCNSCSVYNQNDYIWHAGPHAAQVSTQEGVVGGWWYSNTVNFTVTKAPVTVTANNATKKVGTADPAFSATPDVFSSLTFTTNEPQPATSASIGTYTITPSGGTATDYYPAAYASGTLTVTPANDTTTALARSPSASFDHLRHADRVDCHGHRDGRHAHFRHGDLRRWKHPGSARSISVQAAGPPIRPFLPPRPRSSRWARTR